MAEIQLPSDLNEIKALKEKISVHEGIILEKAIRSDDPNQIIKADAYYKDVLKKEKSKVKSYVFDPFSFQQQFGFKNKRTYISYETLRSMGRTPIINSILTTRVDQVASFAQPAFQDGEVGFIIRKKRSLFDKKEDKVDKSDQRIIEFMVEFLINCGNDSNKWGGDDFDSFLRKVVRDSLELDQLTFEIVRNRKGIPTEFLAVDGATFRMADNFDDKDYNNFSGKKELINGYAPQYVQLYNNRIINEFYPWELCFSSRNKYTDIRLNGYGVSELENIVNVVTWMLYGDQYNGKFFTQGSAPKGILKVSGNIGEGKLAEFRQGWQSMVQGVQNAWRTPVIEDGDMEWIDLQKSNNDMEFGKWQEYLIKLSCATYKIDPSEIGFPMSGSSDAKPLFESNNEGRLKYSKDKGLTPLLKSIEAKINKYIISPIDKRFEFKFQGLSEETENDKIDNDVKKLSNFTGLKEIRRKNGLPDELEDGDLILNPQWMQAYMAKQQEKQQQAQEGQVPDGQSNIEQDEDSDPELEQFQDKSETDVFAKAFNEYMQKEFGS